MDVNNALIAVAFFALGLVVAGTAFYIPMRKLTKMVYKLRGQVYYWSRQMPVTAKRGRPKKSNSVK